MHRTIPILFIPAKVLERVWFIELRYYDILFTERQGLRGNRYGNILEVGVIRKICQQKKLWKK